MDKTDVDARSQLALSQRIWASSDLSATHVQRTRSLSSKRPGSCARPPVSSRPESRGDSRPQSRVEYREQDKLLERPVSGVRPLSGRVFMRRTSERGWIAKAYPDAGYRLGSQTELEEVIDDISDCDSFFDDDFDTETRDEKLGPLLSCNTLGIDSKGRRPDWIAGEVDIPTFHCPRCRDHWYGISDVPCDEELARMKREGLWLLGKDGDKKHRSYGGSKTLRPVSSHREYNALSSGDSATKLPKIRRKKDTIEKEKSGWRTEDGESDSSKKRKKRITFKLDEDQAGSGKNGGGDLSGDHLSADRRGGSHDKSSSGSGWHNGSEEGGERQRGNMRDKSRNTGRNDDSQLGMFDGNRDGLEGGQHGRSKSSAVDQDSLEAASKHLSSNGSETSLFHKRSNQRLPQEQLLSSRNRNGNNEQLNSDGLNGQSKVGSGVERDGSSEHSSNQLEANEAGKRLGIKHGDNISGQSEFSKVEHGNKLTSKTGGSRNGLESNSQASQTSSSKGTGSRRGSLGMSSDHGKNVRKGVGYMRAVSPSSSQWGDPHHGRSFISSTATSRTGSTSNLLRDLDNEKDDDHKSRSLPAIVPQIKKKHPLMDFSDLQGGFQFTRAWTFSYHNKT